MWKECNQIKFPKPSNLFSAIISMSEQRLNNETVVCFGKVPQALFILKVEDCIKSSEVYTKNNYSFKSGLKNYNCSIRVFFTWLRYILTQFDSTSPISEDIFSLLRNNQIKICAFHISFFVCFLCQTIAAWLFCFISPVVKIRLNIFLHKWFLSCKVFERETFASRTRCFIFGTMQYHSNYLFSLHTFR